MPCLSYLGRKLQLLERTDLYEQQMREDICLTIFCGQFQSHGCKSWRFRQETIDFT